MEMPQTYLTSPIYHNTFPGAENATISEIKDNLVVVAKSLLLTSVEKGMLMILRDDGPVTDGGDWPHISVRMALLNKGLIVPTVVKGKDGYSVITYEGNKVLKVCKELDILGDRMPIHTELSYITGLEDMFKIIELMDSGTNFYKLDRLDLVMTMLAMLSMAKKMASIKARL